jgi:hypothetical protein
MEDSAVICGIRGGGKAFEKVRHFITIIRQTGSVMKNSLLVGTTYSVQPRISLSARATTIEDIKIQTISSMVVRTCKLNHSIREWKTFSNRHRRQMLIPKAVLSAHLSGNSTPGVSAEH